MAGWQLADYQGLDISIAMWTEQVVNEVARNIDNAGTRPEVADLMRRLWTEEYLPNLVIVPIPVPDVENHRLNLLAERAPSDVPLASVLVDRKNRILLTSDRDFSDLGFALPDWLLAARSAYRLTEIEVGVRAVMNLGIGLVTELIVEGRRGSTLARVIAMLLAVGCVTVLVNGSRREDARRVGRYVWGGVRNIVGEWSAARVAVELAGPSQT